MDEIYVFGLTPPPFSIYVAGAWTDRKKLKEIMRQWEQQPGRVIVSNWPDREEDPKQSAQNAVFDLMEIDKCSHLVAIMDIPNYAYRGTFTEIGYALGKNKKVYIVCPGTDEYECTQNVFYHHPAIRRHNCLEEVMSLL